MNQNIYPNTTHLLIRHNEISLKGNNRHSFEKLLMRNLQRKVNDCGKVINHNGRILIQFNDNYKDNSDKYNNMIEQLKLISGIHTIAPCKVVPSESHSIEAETIQWTEHELKQNQNIQTFAIRTRRIDKNFPLRSSELEFNIGSKIRQNHSNISTNLKNPDLKMNIEVRQKYTLIYSNEIKGVNGLPLDPSLRAVCLLSGGIDSPVAVFEIMKRGISPILVHFHSMPFTPATTIDKIKKLSQVLRQYNPYPMELWLISLLNIQQQVKEHCTERYRTILYRRFMMRIAEEICRRFHSKAIVTGEALGQVASQTISNIAAIEGLTKTPIFRPLITLDKSQIIEKAKTIGTFDISIEPHEDTCILFAPENPATQARLEKIIEEEERLPIFNLIFNALDNAEKVLI